MQAQLKGIGIAIPEKEVNNQYFESILDTNDEWIVSRTGIKRRFHTASDEFTSSLCVKAVKDLHEKYPFETNDVDLIIVSTVSPDHPMPGMACLVQYRMNMPNAGAFDIYAACAGFAYAVIIAKGMIASGTHKKIIVIGAETLSKVTDFSDRTTAILFGDGAAAVLVEASEQGNIGECVTGAFGEGGLDLYMSGLSPKIEGQAIVQNGKIVQNGRKVFRWAVSTASREVPLLLEKNNLSVETLDWFIPHSANLRIIEAICEKTGIPKEKTLESVTSYGNTSSASIPLALSIGVAQGKVKKGDKILIFGFGGGLTFAGALITWS